jgi:hypothetical protein
LDLATITFEVYDSGIIYNTLLGSYEIDFTSVYYSLDHMLYKTWFTLTDPTDEIEGCLGFVKTTVEILGPDDEPTIVEAITNDPSAQRR